MNKYCVILDAGHSKNTPGKCSPDKSLHEWKWNREVRDKVMRYLATLNIPYYDCHPADVTLGGSESNDLVDRMKKANTEISKQNSLGYKCLFVSIHVNAAGNGSGWLNARGWECYTTVGQNNSDKLSECMYDAAKEILTKYELKIRTDKSDGDSDKESNFYVLRKANCPAVLVENFFMDNKDDLEFIKSDYGKQECANVIAKGILNYINKY